MTVLDKSTFDEIVDLLVPNLDTIPRRQAFVTQSLFDVPMLIQTISYEGDALQFTVNLIRRCNDFGYIHPDKLAIVALLDHLYEQVGYDRQKKIERIINQIVELQVNQDKFYPVAQDTPLPIDLQINEETNRAVFISYARRDGRRLALDLQESLKKHGYTVWLDTSEIEGGTSWSSEIENAIEECDVTVALLSHGSFVSEICRAEQLRALRKGKPVIPVLVQPDAERPLYLEHLNYRDFSDPIQYWDNFRLLHSDLQSDENIPLPENRRETIVSAPPLPPHFIPRTEDLSFLRRTVIGDETDQQIALTAIRGMGGIGKSVLATALCHDEVIQAAFPDGVIWVTIGREPSNLTEQMKFIGTKLGDSPGYYTSEDAGTDRLRTLLSQKAVLLVLDDVWDAKHIIPFRIDAPRCRTLFSTRDGGIALSVGASEVRLGTLSIEQAVSLLTEWAGRDDKLMPKIAERLGYLPLALKLAGARLREGMSGHEWLKTFRHVSQMKLGRRSRDPHENLEVCFDLSVQQLVSEDQLLYHAIGVFPEDVAIPQGAVVKLWRKLDPQLSEYDANELAIDLARLALIDRNNEDETITLHDLLHDYTRSKLGESLKATHIALLEAYNPQNDPWWQVQHDGYIYFQLGYHLIGAGRLDDFIRLLVENPDWMEAKFIACQGDIAYAADLTLAMRQYTDPLDADEAKIVSQLYIARQIVNVRASVYTNDDLETLVWLDRTTEALNHARLRIDPVEKYTGMLSIYRATLERGSQDSEIKAEMLQNLRNIPDDAQRRDHMIECCRLLRSHQDDTHNILFTEALFSFAPARANEIKQIYQIASELDDLGWIRADCFKIAENLALDEPIDGGSLLIKLSVKRNNSVVSRITQKLLETNLIDEAVEIAACVPDEEVLSELAVKLFEDADYDHALKAADAIQDRDEPLRDKTFRTLIEKSLDADLIEIALKFLEFSGLYRDQNTTLLVAKKLLMLGDPKRAIRLFKRVEKFSYGKRIFGDGVDKVELDGIIGEFVTHGYLDQAMDFIEIVASKENDGFNSWKFYLTIIDQLIETGAHDEAIDLVTTFEERKFSLMLMLPLDNLLKQARSLFLFEADEQESTRMLYLQALELDEQCKEALWHLSLLSGESSDEKQQYLEQLFSIDKNMMLEYANYLHQNGNDDDAIALIRRLLQADPAHAMAHCWLSVLKTTSEDEQAYLEDILKLDVTTSRTSIRDEHLQKLLLHVSIDTVREATRYTVSRYTDRPKTPRYWITISTTITRNTGEPDFTYSKLLEISRNILWEDRKNNSMSSKNVDSVVSEAIRAYCAGNKHSARATLKKAAEIDPSNEKAWMWLSAVVDTVEEQRICLENVLYLNPDNVNARRGLVILDSQAPDSSEVSGTSATRSPLLFSKNKINGLRKLSEAGEKSLRMVEEARKWILRAVDIDHRDIHAWISLSSTLEKPNKVICMENILKIDPTNTYAREKLDELNQTDDDDPSQGIKSLSSTFESHRILSSLGRRSFFKSSGSDENKFDPFVFLDDDFA